MFQCSRAIWYWYWLPPQCTEMWRTVTDLMQGSFSRRRSGLAMKSPPWVVSMSSILIRGRWHQHLYWRWPQNKHKDSSLHTRKWLAHAAVGIRLIYSSKIIGAFLASKGWRISPHSVNRFHSTGAIIVRITVNICIYLQLTHISWSSILY